MTDYLKSRWRRMSVLQRLAVILTLGALVAGVGLVLAVDTDQDGMSDEYETFFGLNATNAADAQLNYDADALTNLDEYVLWTDPFAADTDRDGWQDGTDSNAVSRWYIAWGHPFFTSGNDYQYAAPDWHLAAFKDGGEWATNPSAWHVAAAESNGVGRLLILVDRGLLTNDVVMGLSFYDHTNASLYVDLVDSNEQAVATNLFGNLNDGNDQSEHYDLNIPLQTNAAAVGIQIRRGSGEATVYESLLYVDEDGDGLDADQEAQLGTSDYDSDSDNDGANDNAEASAGANPTDPGSFPVDVSGTVAYAGSQTGTIWVVAVTSSSSWSRTRSVALSAPGSFQLQNLPNQTSYWFKAFRDPSGNLSPDYGEPTGVYAANPVLLTNDLSGVSIILTDLSTDTDQDGMLDWWEQQHGFDPFSAALPEPAGHWPLDETSGEIAEDISTNHNDGAVAGAEPAPGVLSHARWFDGADDATSVTNSSAYKPARLTVAVYARFDALYGNSVTGSVPDGTMVLVAQRNAGDGYAYAINKTEMNSLVFEVSGAGSNGTTVVETADDFTVTGKFYHVVGTYDGTNAALYVNGELIEAVPRAAPLEYSESTGLLAGHGGLADDGWFEGVLDDIQVFGVALSPAQVRVLGEPGRDDDEDGLGRLAEYAAGTDPNNADSDDDGANDGEEAQAGTDPLNPASYPVSVCGTLTYTGGQGGTFCVVAVSNALSWSTGRSIALDSPGEYGLTVPGYTSYWFKAFCDTNANGALDYGEPCGSYSAAPVSATNDLSGIDIEITGGATDNDSDNMPDWWEVYYFAGTNYAGAADNDADGLANSNEYAQATDPTERDSDHDGMGDNAEILNGRNPNSPDSFMRLPFWERFESDTVAAGDIQGQNGWTASAANSALVQSNTVHAGRQALEILPSTNPVSARHLFAAVSNSVVWEYYRVQPSRRLSSTPPVIEPSAAAAYYVNSNGQFVVYDGSLSSNRWVTLTNCPPIGTSTWVEVTVSQDFEGKTWALAIDDETVATDLGFANPVTEYSVASLFGGDQGSAFWDSLTVSPVECSPASGEIVYSGPQTGKVYLVVVDLSNGGAETRVDWLQSLNYVMEVYEQPPIPGIEERTAVTNYYLEEDLAGYELDRVPEGDEYRLKAFVDANDNGVWDASEPWGYLEQQQQQGFRMMRLLEPWGTISMGDPDADDDGMPDWWELRHGLDTSTNDAALDPDHDGRSNLEEYQQGYDPHEIDGLAFGYWGPAITKAELRFVRVTPTATGTWVTVAFRHDAASYPANSFTNRLDIFTCSDLIGSWWGLAITTNATSSTNWVAWLDRSATNASASPRFYAAGNADLDSDGDGLADARELYMYHTSTNDPDTDDDGMPDGWEVAHELDPLTDDSGHDADGDGLANSAEYAQGTDPKDADTDNDGMGDGAELLHSRNPTAADEYQRLPFTESFEGPLVKVVASDGTNNDLFGCSAAICGDRAVVGAKGASSSKGAAYVYVRSGTNWTQQAKLTASDGTNSGYFGCSVAIDSSTIVVGAKGDDSSKGAAYVYVRQPSGWQQQRKLVATQRTAGDEFGCSVAVHADTAVVGAQMQEGERGAAYVFVRTGTNWTQQQRLISSDRAQYDRFGGSVGIHGNTAVAGAVEGANAKGAAYVFGRSGTNWLQKARLMATGGATWDYFGCSVGITGDDAIVGAYGHDPAGAAYVFSRDGTNWPQRAQLDPPGGSVGDGFGWSACISSNRALAGSFSGQYAYFFCRTGTVWRKQAKLTSPHPLAGGQFGYAVGLSSNGAIAGQFAASPARAYVCAPIGVYTGDLSLQNGWLVSSSDRAMVQSSCLHSGKQALRIASTTPAVSVRHLIAGCGHPTVWENYCAKAVRRGPGDAPATNAASTAVYYVNSNGSVVVYDGHRATNRWLTLASGPTVSASAWTRFTVKQTFTDRTWSLWINGTNVAEALGFMNPAAEFSIVSYAGGKQADSHLDCLTVSPTTSLRSVRGSVSYSGRQTGAIRVCALVASNGVNTDVSTSAFVPGSYAITNVPGLNLTWWLKAYRDSNGNGSRDSWEAAGAYAANPVYVPTNVAGVNIALVDPDTDSDGMPDWWEILHFGGATNAVPTADADTDGLNNLSEYSWNTLPHDTDTDNDGLSDGTEVNSIGTDPVDFDTDGDGLVDGYDGHTSINVYPQGANTDSDGWVDGEMDVSHGTAPLLYDTDGDGLVDGVDGLISVAVYPAGADGDADGYVDGEVNHGTVATDVDTDNDGYGDGWEVRYGLDPLDDDDPGPNNADNDGDGLTNLQEYQNNSDPNSSDTDLDGMGDWAEVANGMSPAVSNAYYSLPFEEGFESGTVGQGAIHGKNGWFASPTNLVLSVASNFHAGARSAQFKKSFQAVSAYHLFRAHGLTNVWIDCWMKCVPTNVVSSDRHPDIHDTPEWLPTVFVVNGMRQLLAYDGTAAGVWRTASNVLVSAGSHHRYTVRQDYVGKRWDLYYDGARVLSTMGFTSASIVEFSRFSAWGKWDTGGFLDDVRVATNRPAGLTD